MSKPLHMNRLIGNDGKRLRIKKDLNDCFCPSSITMFNLTAEDDIELSLVEVHLSIEPYKENRIDIYCVLKFRNNEIKLLILEKHLNEYIEGISPLILIMEHYKKNQNRDILKKKIDRYSKIVKFIYSVKDSFSY